MPGYGSTEDMVSRLFDRGHEVATKTAKLASDFSVKRENVRERLSSVDMIHSVSEGLIKSISIPSVCAVDGALICDSRAIGDVCTAVGVAIGPNEVPRNEIWMECVSRNSRNKEILTGIMSAMELRLAASSDAELVMIDGSLTSALINISKAILHSYARKTEIEEAAMSLVSNEMRDAVMEILTSKRFVAVPKYTTTNTEFSTHLPDVFKDFDGRTVATMALKSGEMMQLFRSEEQKREDFEVSRRRVGNALQFSESVYLEFVKAATSVVYSYYRPHPWTPAFRFDVPYTLYDDVPAGQRVLKALHETTLSPGVREPMPLYVVDAFAKQISAGVSPVMDMASVKFDGDDEALLLMIMGYRT